MRVSLRVSELELNLRTCAFFTTTVGLRISILWVVVAHFDLSENPKP